MTAYADAVRALTDRGRFGIRLGLGRVRALLRELGDPHLASRGALVAGTNGKGSVIALAGSALRVAGHHVAETPKPHLVTYRERMVMDGRPIDHATFARLVDEVLPIADRIERRHGPPTEFELLTAMLFRWFAEEGVEVALVEVGLGGRLDATNVWDGGVAAVTNVDLDHTDRLGTTIPAIAREKAAIIKRGDRAVTGASGDALEVVRRRAGRLRVPLRIVAPAPIRHHGRDGLVVDLPGMAGVGVALRGRHQAANVAVADAVLDALAASGLPSADVDARRAGYAAARWPGRLELLTLDGRDVLLDGAHNPAGAATLARALDDLQAELTPGPLTLVWATMVDKDVEAVIAAMSSSRALEGALVLATQVAAPRALPAAELAARWRARVASGRVVAEPDPLTAIDQARRDAAGPIVIAGSLYLVGIARAHLVDDPSLRDPPP